MKRGGHSDGSFGKRVKVDDPWDDEYDSDAIDDCFKLATQVCEKDQITCTQLNNVTLLSTYSAFKPPTHSVCTSTQLESEINFNGRENVELQIKLLRERFAEKEGEVAILRSNLKGLRATCINDNERKQQEWSEKYNLTMKEMNSVKSELEFKNLEIANLKQRVNEMAKCLATAQNSTQSKSVQKEKKNTTSPHKDPLIIDNNNENKLQKTWRVRFSEGTVYPLQCFDYCEVFKLPKSTKQSSQDKLEDLSFNNLLPEFSFLIGCDLIQLQSQVSISKIDEIVRVSLQFLMNFHDKLVKIESEIRLEEIQHLDSTYLDTNNKLDKIDLNLLVNYESGDDEIGVKCGKVLMFLAELLQFSRYFQECVNVGSNLNRNFPVLKLILNIVTIIGKTRQAHKCSRFLSALLKFIISAFKLGTIDDEILELLIKIVKEILFARPLNGIVAQIPSLLKIATLNSKFAARLCTESRSGSRKKRLQGVLIHHTGDSCIFQIFVSLFHNLLSKTDVIPLNLNKSYLCFVNNLFKSNVAWLYYKEGAQSECLYQLYRMTVKMVHKTLEMYKSKKDRNECSRGLINMSIKILNLLTFNSVDLTEKYITVYAQYRDIVNTLLTHKEDLELDVGNHLNDLEKLNISEEIPTIPISDFDLVGF